MDDIFHRSYENYLQWGGYLPELKLITLIRILLFFVTVTLIYYFTFITQHRKGFGRILLSVIGIMLILSFKIPIPSNHVLRTWLLTLSILLAFGLPAVLPFYVLPQAGKQPRVKATLYAVLAGLLLIGMLYT